ncbi:MAG: hypothetical protein NVSMB46_05980 [Candidatus Saccharimonadales bacterium]
MKIKKHIEIVRSSTSSLSSMGEKSSDMIQSVLEKIYETVGISLVSNQSDLDDLIAKQPDLALLGMKNVPKNVSSMSNQDNNIWVSQYLADNGINYTGSHVDAMTLDFHKSDAKNVVRTAGINTAAYFLAFEGQYHQDSDLPLSYPLFAKPPAAGGGKGVDTDSVIRNFSEFQRKITAIAHEFQSPALVEHYLTGREFSVAIFDNPHSSALMVMPIELITEPNHKGDRILGGAIKSADTEHVIAIHDEDTKQQIVELAQDAFLALGARDYGRIDIRMDEHGVPYFLEANLIPGIAYHDFTSYFTNACWINEHMSYESMIKNIISIGLSRTTTPALTS